MPVLISLIDSVIWDNENSSFLLTLLLKFEKVRWLLMGRSELSELTPFLKLNYFFHKMHFLCQYQYPSHQQHQTPFVKLQYDS